MKRRASYFFFKKKYFILLSILLIIIIIIIIIIWSEIENIVKHSFFNLIIVKIITMVKLCYIDIFFIFYFLEKKIIRYLFY